jgi:glutathione S-transferase
MYIIETRQAPNPRRVRIFLTEKGISIPFEERDLMAGELKTVSFTRMNPWQRVPVLVFDDGRVICETVAICRYFEELHPEPALMGVDPFDKATVEMWQRRVELGILTHIAQVIRHLNPKMAHLEVPQVAEWGEANKPKAAEALKALDARLADSRFIAGDRYTIADVTALVAIDFMKPAKLKWPDGVPNIQRWHSDVSSRPSASA